MVGYAVTNELLGRRPEPGEKGEEYYSVEFSIDGLNMSYQFKILDTSPRSLCVLIKETSEIIPLINVGDILNLKYYSSKNTYYPQSLETEIRHIRKNDQGRFKGHYLVGLKIIESIH